MKITANTVVTLDYKVTDPEHAIVDPGESPLVYLHGHDGIFPKLEGALEGKSVGDALEVHLEPPSAHSWKARASTAATSCWWRRSRTVKRCWTATTRSLAWRWTLPAP